MYIFRKVVSKKGKHVTSKTENENCYIVFTGIPLK